MNYDTDSYIRQWALCVNSSKVFVVLCFTPLDSKGNPLNDAEQLFSFPLVDHAYPYPESNTALIDKGNEEKDQPGKIILADNIVHHFNLKSNQLTILKEGTEADDDIEKVKFFGFIFPTSFSPSISATFDDEVMQVSEFLHILPDFKIQNSLRVFFKSNGAAHNRQFGFLQQDIADLAEGGVKLKPYRKEWAFYIDTSGKLKLIFQEWRNSTEPRVTFLDVSSQEIDFLSRAVLTLDVATMRPKVKLGRHAIRKLGIHNKSDFSYELVDEDPDNNIKFIGIAYFGIGCDKNLFTSKTQFALVFSGRFDMDIERLLCDYIDHKLNNGVQSIQAFPTVLAPPKESIPVTQSNPTPSVEPVETYLTYSILVSHDKVQVLTSKWKTESPGTPKRPISSMNFDMYPRDFFEGIVPSVSNPPGCFHANAFSVKILDKGHNVLNPKKDGIKLEAIILEDLTLQTEETVEQTWKLSVLQKLFKSLKWLDRDTKLVAEEMLSMLDKTYGSIHDFNVMTVLKNTNKTQVTKIAEAIVNASYEGPVPSKAVFKWYLRILPKGQAEIYVATPTGGEFTYPLIVPSEINSTPHDTDSKFALLELNRSISLNPAAVDELRGFTRPEGDESYLSNWSYLGFGADEFLGIAFSQEDITAMEIKTHVTHPSYVRRRAALLHPRAFDILDAVTIDMEGRGHQEVKIIVYPSAKSQEGLTALEQINTEEGIQINEVKKERYYKGHVEWSICLMPQGPVFRLNITGPRGLERTTLYTNYQGLDLTKKSGVLPATFLELKETVPFVVARSEGKWETIYLGMDNHTTLREGWSSNFLGFTIHSKFLNDRITLDAFLKSKGINLPAEDEKRGRTYVKDLKTLPLELIREIFPKKFDPSLFTQLHSCGLKVCQDLPNMEFPVDWTDTIVISNDNSDYPKSFSPEPTFQEPSIQKQETQMQSQQTKQRVIPWHVLLERDHFGIVTVENGKNDVHVGKLKQKVSEDDLSLHTRTYLTEEGQKDKGCFTVCQTGKDPIYFELYPHYQTHLRDEDNIGRVFTCINISTNAVAEWAGPPLQRNTMTLGELSAILIGTAKEVVDKLAKFYDAVPAWPISVNWFDRGTTNKHQQTDQSNATNGAGVNGRTFDGCKTGGMSFHPNNFPRPFIDARDTRFQPGMQAYGGAMPHFQSLSRSVLDYANQAASHFTGQHSLAAHQFLPHQVKGIVPLISRHLVCNNAWTIAITSSGDLFAFVTYLGRPELVGGIVVVSQHWLGNAFTGIRISGESVVSMEGNTSVHFLIANLKSFTCVDMNPPNDFCHRTRENIDSLHPALKALGATAIARDINIAVSQTATTFRVDLDTPNSGNLVQVNPDILRDIIKL